MPKSAETTETRGKFVAATEIVNQIVDCDSSSNCYLATSTRPNLTVGKKKKKD